MIPRCYGKFVYGDIVRGRIFYSDINEMIAAHDGIYNTTAHRLRIVPHPQRRADHAGRR